MRLERHQISNVYLSIFDAKKVTAVTVKDVIGQNDSISRETPRVTLFYFFFIRKKKGFSVPNIIKVKFFHSGRFILL